MKIVKCTPTDNKYIDQSLKIENAMNLYLNKYYKKAIEILQEKYRKEFIDDLMKGKAINEMPE